ncbi:MAG: helicase-associated domain-containing protein [Candidatus Nanopelagicales bacterium]
MTDGPLIVQSDHTLLLEIDHPQAEACRREIAVFAELERSPEHVHTYRLTKLGLWNARAAGHDAEQIVDTLVRYSRFPISPALLLDVTETVARYGRLELHNHPAHGLVLVSHDRAVLAEVLRHKKTGGMLGAHIDDDTVAVHPSERGRLKQALLAIGWPAEDLAGYVDGEAHPIALREQGWVLRDYQRQAAENAYHGGSGVVVLPCGAGKTIVGAAAMAMAQATTLILVTNTVAARQWRSELLATDDPDRGRDRRVQRTVQGDPAGHDRDLPDPDVQAEGRVRPPRTLRCPQLGPDPLRRGAPAARARVPLHRRHPEPAPASG